MASIETRPPGRLRVGVSAAAMALCAAACAAPARADRVDVLARTMAASEAVCSVGMEAPPASGASLLGEKRFAEGPARSWLRDWRVGPTDMIRVVRVERDGQPTLDFVAYYGGPAGRRPFLRLVRDERCGLRGGERIIYGEGGAGPAQRLELLDRDLKLRAAPVPINPPVPSEAGPGTSCTRVGFLDNGVNYLLPQVAQRLARDADGAIVGRDFWEGDDLPFDFGLPEDEPDVRLSAFQPPQHGTGVISVFLADAPDNVCPAAYRYSPNDARGEIGAMVDRIASDGVRVLVMASGRDRPWPDLEAAMRRHPEILFVAASGNDGVDLHDRDLYPMIYEVPNLLVVAASDRDGGLWPRSNRGDGIVALALPAVKINGFRFDGSPVELTGTSFASPRAGALAGVLAAANPSASGADLKARILEVAAERGTAKDGMVLLGEQDFRKLLIDAEQPKQQ